MEGPFLFLVISCILAGSVSGNEARCPSRCQWNDVNFLNCRSTGISTVGDPLFFLEKESRNETSSDHIQKCLSSTKDIDLSYNMMTTLYLNIFYKFVSLETLNITSNQIYRVALNTIGKQHEEEAFLASLRTLVLNGNRLIAIPKGLCKLKSLQTLSLSANRILYIQRNDFANCTELQHIDLGENRISNIHPDAFWDLRNLQVLKLHSNTLVSLSPLVFLFKHVLKADIDLSGNLWACDCSLQPLKYLISSMSMGVGKPLNVTCNTPYSKAGQHILSLENEESCQATGYSFVFEKMVLITAGEEATLDCGSFNQFGNTDVLWWTPRGIISKENQIANNYLSETSSLILEQPDDSDEGLYICLTNATRIAYQVAIPVNNIKNKRRSPRDLQLKNVRMPTQQNFDLAVSLSVIITFLVAFCLGVFIRPYLENLWKKRCKSKDSESQPSGAVYDNEGFTAEYTTRKHGENSNMSSLPQQETRQTFQKSDKYNLEVENTTGRQDHAIEVLNPTYNAAQNLGENKLAERLPKTKRVKWAINEDSSPNVNLKYYMSLLKPINFIVIDPSLPDMVHDHTKSENADDINVHKHNKDITKMLDDSCSSDEGSSFSLDSEYYSSDDDSIIKVVYQEAKQRRQDCDDNASLRINLKHLTSLLKPLHIVIPDSTVPAIVKSPKQKQFFPIGISAYPENSMESVDNTFQNNLQGNYSSDNTYKKKNQASNALYDTSSSDERSNYSLDSEYELSDEDDLLNFKILGRKETKKASNDHDKSTVNLKYVISLLKPINIIIPEPTTIRRSEPQLRDTSRIYSTASINDSSDEESTISVSSEHFFSAEDEFTDTNVLKSQTRLSNETLVYDSSSSEHSSTDSDDSDKTVIKSSISNTLPPRSWEIIQDEYPTVNLRQVISTLTPIKIKVPEMHYSSSLLGPKDDFKVTSQKLYYYSSSDEHSDSSDQDNLDEVVNRSPILPVPLPSERTDSENAYTSVNLKHIISSVKPIPIYMPDSTHYTETLVIPKKNTEVTQKPYEFSTSESSDSDNDSSDEFVKRSPLLPVPPPRKRADSENFYTSVNLKHIITSFKPIPIHTPDAPHYTDTLLIPKKDTEVTQKPYEFSSSESSDSDHDSSEQEFLNRSPTLPVPPPRKRKDSETVYTIVNLKHMLSSFRPIPIHMPGPTQYMDTLVTLKKDPIVTEKPYELSSSESCDYFDSDSSDEFVNRSPTLTVLPPRKRVDSEDVYTIVNLRHLICTFKPIHIQLPGSPHYMDTLITPKKDTMITEKPYEFSSSESSDSGDSEHERSDEEVLQSIILPKQETQWTSHTYSTPTVNLRNLISSLRPIHIYVPGPSHYSDITQEKDIEENQKPYVFHSHESSDSDQHSSDEFVNRSPMLPVPPVRNLADSEKDYTRVNIKQIISSFKPIAIHMPDSPPYTDTLLTPKKDTEITQRPYKFSSSESSESDLDSSDEFVVISPTLPVPPPRKRTDSEKRYTSVNLKHIISLFKPIPILMPGSAQYTETLVTPMKGTGVTEKPDELSSDSSDSEYESSYKEVIMTPSVSEQMPEWKTPAVFAPATTEWSEDFTTTVNLKQVISSFRPMHINTPDTNSYSEIPFKKHTSVSQMPYDVSPSITTESESSSESADSEHESLEEKPIQSIILQEQKSEWENHEHTTPTVNLKYLISSVRPIHIYIPGSSHYTDTLVPEHKDIEVTQEPRELSSSESSDSDHDSSDDFVNRSPMLPVPPPRRSSSKKVDTSVNLKHIISSLKPIPVFIPDSAPYTDYLPLPKKDTEVTKTPYNFSSSESSDDSGDSEHESLYKEVIMIPNVSEQKELKTPAVFVPEATEWSEDFTPTVNLKQVIASFRPIHINSPDTNSYSEIPFKKYTSVSQKPYDVSPSITTESESSSESADSENESLEEEPIQSIILQEQKSEWENHEHTTPTVNLKYLISSVRPIHIYIPGSSHYTDTLVPEHKDIEVTQEPRELSSSESSDSDHDSSDDFVNRSPILPVPPPRRSSSKKVDTSVNLKHIISSLKPIPVFIPDSPPYTDYLSLPKKDTEVTQTPYNFSSSESSDSDHDSAEEFVNRSPMLPVPPPRKKTDSENIYVSLNLRSIISSFKPIPIHMAGSINYSDTLVTPKKDTSLTEKPYDFSSSESSDDSGDSEHESLNKEVIMTPIVSEQKELKTPAVFVPAATEWSEDLTPTVNLKQVIASFRPIHINSPDTNSYSEIPFKKYTSVSQMSYDVSPSITTESESSSESADSEHESLEEEPIQSIILQEQKTEWENYEHPTPTVNLKHLISSVKPIQIYVPGSSHYIDNPVTEDMDKEVSQKPRELSSSESSDSDHDSSNHFVNRTPTLPIPPPRKRSSSKKVDTNVNLKHIISSLKPIPIYIPNSPHYTDSLLYPKKDTEVTQTPYTFSSSESSDSDHDSAEEFVRGSSTLPVPPPRKRTNSEKVYAIVNLRDIISSFKPIPIHMAGSIPYADTLVTHKKDISVTEKPYDFSSSESSDDSGDSEHEVLYKEVIMTPVVSEQMQKELKTPDVFAPATTEWSEDLTPTVNLKKVIATFRPIHINSPDTNSYSEIPSKKHTSVSQMPYEVSPSITTESESSSESADSEHEEEPIQSISLREQKWENHEHPTPTVNLKYLISSVRPIQIYVPDSSHYTDTLVTEEKTQEPRELSSSESSDSDHDSSDEFVNRTPKLPVPPPRRRSSSKKVDTSVNLNHIISTLKPIRIYIPDSPHFTDYQLYPKKDTEVTQTPYKLSSSESSDSDHDSSEGFVNRSPLVPEPPPRKRASSKKVYTSVNLKNIISSFKPILIHIPGSINYTGTLITPKKDTAVTQNPQEISSSESSDDSADSEHESSYEEIIMTPNASEPMPTEWKPPALFVPTGTERASNMDFIPTVNLREVMSSLKPIHVSICDTSSKTVFPVKKDAYVGQKQYNLSSSDTTEPGSSSESNDSDEEVIKGNSIPELAAVAWIKNENLAPKVNLKNLILLFKPIQIKVPDTTHDLDTVMNPKMNIETTTQKWPDYSSYDESSNDSFDTEHKSYLPKPFPTTGASHENISTMNLKHFISTFKPLHIKMADSTIYLSTPTEVMQKQYGNISSDKMPTVSNKDSEDIINICEPVSNKLASNENIYHTVNFKNVIKPIPIIIQDLPNYSISSIIPMNTKDVSKKLYKRSSSDDSSAESGHEGSYEVTNEWKQINSSTSEDSSDSEPEVSHEGIILVKHSNLSKPTPTEQAKDKSLSPTENFRPVTTEFDVQGSPYYSEPLMIPKKNIEVIQQKYDSSNVSEPDMYVTKSYFLPNLKPTERTTNENSYATVNLRYVISSLKPIKVRVSESSQYKDIPMISGNISVTSNKANDINISNEPSNYLADSKHEGTVKDDYPTVNLKHVAALVKPIQFKVPDSDYYFDTFRSSRKTDKVTKKKHSSSDDESSKDSDSEHDNLDENRISYLGKPTVDQARTEVSYPTVKPINLTSSKPATILSPENEMPEIVRRPKWKPFFLKSSSSYKEQPISHSFSPPQSQVDDKKSKRNFYTFKNPNTSTNVILTSYKKTPSNATSGNIDDWGNKGYRSDPTHSDILKSKLTPQASNEDDAYMVNLKHKMSLINPVRIIAPELQTSQVLQDPPFIPLRMSTFHEKPLAARHPEQHSTMHKNLSQSHLMQFHTDSSEEDAL